MMKKVFALALVVCMMLTLASFPATAATTNPKRVKIFTMGDSFTAGVIEPNAYRYYIYEPLIQDGAVFEFIGKHTSGDFRVSSLYKNHGGVGGAIIGCADDYKWNGSSWATNSWTYTNSNTGVTIKSSGNKNSIHYRLFAGSDGSNDYTKTEYGNYVAEADIVTLYIGLNDYYSAGATGLSADIEHVKQRYYTIVDRIYEINPNVSLYVCSLNEVDYLRGYNLNPGDAGYDTSVFAYNEFILNDVVETYTNKGKKITGVSLNQPGYKMIVGVDNPSDDAHPNEKGNKKIGTQIYMAIKDEVLALNAEGSNVAYNPTRVTSLTLDKTSATLKTGENLTLTSTIAPSSAEIITTIFSSSDESVATVDYYGRVTAVAPGTATIYATALDSMRPDATEIKQACTVTVTDEDYVKMGDNFLPVFTEDFAAAGAWTGNTEYIKGKAYKHDETKSKSSITTKRTFDLKEGFSISFRAALMGSATKEVNNTNKASHYTSVKIGNYEIRIAVNGKVVSFYYNGQLVDERIFSVPVVRQNDDSYTLTKYQDTVYVYRNNELLFTSEVNKYDTAEGNVTLSIVGSGSKNIRDLKVTSIYGLQKLEPTAKNNTKDASAAVDGSTATRYSVESGIGATAGTWTSANNSVVLDLGTTYDISDLNIYWGAYSSGAWGKTMPDAYNVYYSEDGTTYTPAKSYSDIHAFIRGEVADAYTSTTTSFAASHPSWATGDDRTTYSYGVVKEAELGWENVRYIKIEMTKVSINPTIAEIEVYTTAYAPGEEPDGVVTSYTVNYVDTQGNTLAESKTGTGYIDGRITEKAVEIKGYTPDEASKAIILVDGENTITFVYTLVPEKLPLTADNVIAVKDWGWTNDGKLTDATKDALFDGESATDTKGYFAYGYYGVKEFADNANYIEIDLGAVYDISHVVIQGGASDWNYVHLLAYDIYVAGADEVYGNIAVGKQDFGTSVTSANKVRTDTTNIKTNDVRYIKIVGKVGARRPVIGEIEVYRSMEANAEKVETSYTVNYVDTEGNPVMTAKTEAGYVGDEVTEKAPAITGYAINDAEKTITLVDGTNEITFTYTKRTPATYTVNYIDSMGTPIAATKVVEGYVDDVVTETAVAVSGYETEEETKTITLIDGENTIIFTYTENKGVVTISYYGKSGTSSTNNYPFENAVDGDDSTAWVSDQYKGSQGNGTVSVVYKLSENVTLDGLVIKWGCQGQWGYQAPNSYNVYVSADGTTWGDPILTYTDLYNLAKGTHDNVEVINASDAYRKINVTETGLNATNVQYIKVEIKNWRYRISMFEISVTATAAAGPETPSVPNDTIEPLGANIRLESEDLSAGLRFGASIDKAKAGIVGEYTYSDDADVKFGMFLLPKNMLAEGQTLTQYLAGGVQSALNIVARNIKKQNDEVVEYTAVITGIPESAWDRVVVAVPYAYVNGSYIFFEEKEQSYLGVAQAAIDSYLNGNPNNITPEQYDTLLEIVG